MGSPPAGPVLNAETATSAYRVALPEFEGPLDLLLHLCKTHEIEIVNIPISFITTKYLEYLEVMQTMPVDVAADYLVMAATLAYLKSRELVPQPEPLEATIEAGEEDVLDPREELIRRLLEYQKYKDAAEKLGGRPIEGRNVFGRGAPIDADDPGVSPLADHSVWKLIEAFGKILDKAAPGSKTTHDVIVERVSIGDRINELVDRLQGGGGSFRFDSCFDLTLPAPELRHQVVVTLLAVLELARLKVIRVLQAEAAEGGEPEGTLFVTHVDGSDLEAARRVLVTSVEEGDKEGDREGDREGDGEGDRAEDTQEDAAGAESAEAEDEVTDAGSSFDEESAADSTLVEPAPAGADDASLQERGDE
ncbi:MAG: chromosome segregation and condensation protein ScpA [Myxococcales bacterium]|nr:chromosome segregation and condensation protein ScpA [Myxococcales bacterium]